MKKIGAIVAVILIAVFGWIQETILPISVQILLEKSDGRSVPAVNARLSFLGDAPTSRLYELRSSYRADAAAIIAAGLAQNSDIGTQALNARARLAQVEQKYNDAWRDRREGDKSAPENLVVELAQEVSSVRDEVAQLEESASTLKLKALRESVRGDIAATVASGLETDRTDDNGYVKVPRGASYMIVAISPDSGQQQLYFASADWIRDGRLTLTARTDMPSEVGEWMFGSFPD